LSASHNGAACLLRGDHIVAAIQEERLTGSKRERIFGAEPSLAVRYCLESAGIGAADLDLVVLSVQGRAGSPEQDVACNRQLQLARHGVPFLTLSHHLAHAVAAYATSGFSEAAILVVDGIGSPFDDLSAAEQAVCRGGPDGWEMISLYHAAGATVEPIEKHLVSRGDWLLKNPPGMPRFRSLGGMYSAAASQIFGDPMEAGKVMGLAAFGRADTPPDRFFTIEDGGFVFRDDVPASFQHDRRWTDCEGEYCDLAASVQRALETAILMLARRLAQLAPSTNLCYAGGVALNCPANERLHRESGFRSIYVPPAADDSGPAIGAAYYGLWQMTRRNTLRALQTDGAGRPYRQEELDAALVSVPGVSVACQGLPAVLDETVRRLCGGQLAGWFQGRSELGPRALGHRSILADPRSCDAKTDLNSRVKLREAFRPFAPAILASEASAWFELDASSPESPFMLRSWPFRPELRCRVPAVVHQDGTGRAQTVDAAEGGPFHELLQRFATATGVPILLNTSFNGRGEPIVETPEDALWCLLQNGLDFVVLEDRLIEKDPALRSLLDLFPALSARSYAVEIPIVDQRFSSQVQAGADLVFRVETRWGSREVAVPGHLYPVLWAIDGATDGWALLEKLAAQAARPVKPAWLNEILGRLRRTGILALHREPLSSVRPRPEELP